ncbi:MAG TPA: haloacid dehalogenase type II [Aggregatilineales bacterium]|nr:haloacid dehalogenase type II [Aggregatilineales bacterium]
MTRAVIFDVNETLLNLNVLDPHFESVFGDAGSRTIWFSQVLQIAFVHAVLGIFHEFAQIGRVALAIIAGRYGLDLSEEQIAQIVGQMLNLPPHPEVAENLARLKQHNFTIAALTNSGSQMAVTQLTNAGIAPYFDHILSVDSVSQLKPAQAVYQFAVQTIGVAASEAWFMAAHDWDIAGAMQSGMKGAFINRSNAILNPLYPAPDIIGRDLTEVTDQILSNV